MRRHEPSFVFPMMVAGGKGIASSCNEASEMKMKYQHIGIGSELMTLLLSRIDDAWGAYTSSREA